MGFSISIDPGLAASGYVVWKDGKPFAWKTIYPKGADTAEKLLDLAMHVRDLFGGYAELLIDPVTLRVAVEEFEPGFHKGNKNAGMEAIMTAMMKCESAKGVIVGVAFCFTRDIQMVNKGKTPKAHSDLRWQAMGLGKKPSEHVRDALELGCVAGFDRRFA